MILEDLSEEEKYLVAILLDRSGVDLAEFIWKDIRPDNPSGVFRCWDFQYAWYRQEAKLIVDQACRSVGKALALDTPVPTPTGWTTMGEITAGDVVYDDLGNETVVVEAFPILRNRECFEVEFSNGDVIVCDGGHLWRTWGKSARAGFARGNTDNGPLVHTTFEIADSLRKWGESNHSIPVTGPLQGRETELSVDPYVLGVWLDDGHSYSAVVYLNDGDAPEIVRHLRAAGVEVEKKSTRFTYRLQFPDVDVHTWHSHSVTATLRRLGVLENKHIPTQFMRAPIKDRWALLQGLMDTDGHVTKSGWCELTLTNERLAIDAFELVVSLGEKATINEGVAAIDGRVIGPKWRIGWRPRCEAPFRLERHLARLRDTVRPFGHHVRIVDVRSVESVPVRCITVDAASHMYLAGRSMIPTHNSVGVTMRASAFPFSYPSEGMMITAPELVHLEPLTKAVEDRILENRLCREFLQRPRGGKSPITHRPFEVSFRNGSYIIARIPQISGKGVKGSHVKVIEQDEGQDYPQPGFVEIVETLKYAGEGAVWRAHGVSRGVQDEFWKMTQDGSGWLVNRLYAMQRPDWSDEERQRKIALYGSQHHPDYRRNILGAHGDAQSPLFVQRRLFSVIDDDQESEYNREEYQGLRLTGEDIDDGTPIGMLVPFSTSHLSDYKRFWIGADIGLTQAPTDIAVFAETDLQWGRKRTHGFKLLTRIRCEHVSVRDQRRLFGHLTDFYQPVRFAMDRTGMGLPLFQEILEGDNKLLAKVVRGYDFGEKVFVGVNPETSEEIMANVLEWSSDKLRGMVDQREIMLPWDRELINEFQGVTYTLKKSTQNPYGRKVFNRGSFHALDAVRMAVLAFHLIDLEDRDVEAPWEPVLDSAVSIG